MDYRSMTITGRLGRDAEFKTTSNGNNLCEFSVATGYKEKNEDNTDWIRCTLWGKAADAIGSYLKKGTQVLVTGEPRFRTYQKSDGTAGFEVSIAFPTVRLLGGGQRQGGGESAPASDDDSTIPF